MIEIPEIIYDKNKFEINGNEIKVKEYWMVNLYFKYKEKKQFQKIITKENEITYCHSFIKCFEITLNDIDNKPAESIGVILSPDELIEERMVRWYKGTIGLHSNDGIIYNENDYKGIEITQSFKRMM